MDFVDEQQDVAVAGHNFLHNGFQAFLEFALILGTRDQGTHVERVDHLRFALDPRQGRDGPVGLVAQAADIHPDTPQEERGERIVLADKHAQNMERLDSLLSALPGKRQCTLQSLLRFYS